MTLPASAYAQHTDVPYVQTPPVVVDAMLKLANVGPGDYLIDLGSGDGRIVIAAAKKFGARGMGVDLDGALVSEARREAARTGVRDKAEFHTRNIYVTELAPATVVTMYLFPNVNMQLRPRLLTEAKPGTRIVSHEFDMGSWKPDAQVTLPVPDKRYGPPQSTIYMWVVPANAAGTWRWELASGGALLECELTLDQRFQEVRGSAKLAGQPARVESARLRGDTLAVVVNGAAGGRELRVELNGRVNAEVIEGTARVAGTPAGVPWHALRTIRGKINVE